MNHFSVICENEAATITLAETMALALRHGDLVTLKGDLAAGKTTLARAIIRSAAADQFTEVPSPTFTLVQSYEELPFGSLTHMDLYRIEDGSEIEELGLDEALTKGVVVIEWPQKANGFLPEPSIAITIEQNAVESRIFTFQGAQEALNRIERSLAIRSFLNANGHENSTRAHLTGDASSRAYETIIPKKGENIILMNAPPMADGAPIQDGKPYSQIAKLAENMRPFVALAQTLAQQDFRAPHIYAQDLTQGFLLLENLGTDSIVTDANQPIEQRYLVAVETLAEIHQKKWQSECPMVDGITHHIPAFDREAILIEVALLSDWYAPYKLDRQLHVDEKEAFTTIWNGLIDQLESTEKSLVLRDYHSPNVIWLDGAKGSSRIGIIDFQDALIGPTAYDVASLAQDARVDVSVDLETKLVDHYCLIRENFEEQQFRQAYAIMAAERATKVLGIFVRLSKRDGKHGYLSHLPRIEEYLRRSLSHPMLADYRNWVENVLHKQTAK